MFIIGIELQTVSIIDGHFKQILNIHFMSNGVSIVVIEMKS